MVNKVHTYDAVTNTETVRDFTESELAQQELDKQTNLMFKEELKNKENIRTTAKAKLAALGLTEAEVNALIGGS